MTNDVGATINGDPEEVNIVKAETIEEGNPDDGGDGDETDTADDEPDTTEADPGESDDEEQENGSDDKAT